jgi:hypothetical protein
MGLDKEKSSKHSLAMIGRTAWNKGDKGLKPWMNISGFKPGWNKGIQQARWVGVNNPNWAGGVTPINEKIRHSIEYGEWRDAVLKRDNYACVLCGVGGWGNIHADHIKPFAHYPELRLELSNGRTLCKPCHLKTPTYGNRKRLINA